MTSKIYVQAGLALALAAAAGFGVARWTAASPPVEAPADGEHEAPADRVAMTPEGIAASGIGVGVATSAEVDAVVSAAATAEATPDAEAVLTARAPGTVTRILKRIGDPVAAGETIALVESRDASALVADRASASARVTLAGRQLARERTLLAQGASARADYETAQAALAVAQAEVRRASAASGAVRVAGDGQSVAVVSPIAGRITAAPANLGQYVSAETALFRVADPRRVQVVASIPVGESARVRGGDRVELVTTDGRTIAGRVGAATGVVDPESRAGTVVIAPGVGGNVLAPGQLVQARSGAAARGGVAVPEDAVQTLGGRSVVFVRTPQGFRAQEVRTGARSAGMVAVTGGLKAGTPIATANAFLLKAELGKSAGEEH